MHVQEVEILCTCKRRRYRARTRSGDIVHVQKEEISCTYKKWRYCARAKGGDIVHVQEVEICVWRSTPSGASPLKR